MIPNTTLYPRDVSTFGTERTRSLVGLISLPNTQGVLCLQAPDGNEFYIFQDGITPSFGGVTQVMAGSIAGGGCNIGTAVTPTRPTSPIRDGLTIMGSRKVSSSLAIAANPVAGTAGLSGCLAMMTGYGNAAAYLYLHKTAANTWQLTIGTEAQFLADTGGTAVGTPVVGSGSISPTQITMPFERHEGRVVIGNNSSRGNNRLPSVMFIESAGQGAGLAFEYGTDDDTGPVTSPAVVMYFPFPIAAPVFVTPDAWMAWNAVLVVTTASLPGGTSTVLYPPTQLTAQGGSAPYTWSVTVGALPAGLSMSTGGLITGTPTTAGTSNFTVQVSTGTATATKALSIVVA